VKKVIIIMSALFMISSAPTAAMFRHFLQTGPIHDTTALLTIETGTI
jgi:hypothetical protein